MSLKYCQRLKGIFTKVFFTIPIFLVSRDTVVENQRKWDMNSGGHSFAIYLYLSISICLSSKCYVLYHTESLSHVFEAVSTIISKPACTKVLGLVNT